MKVTKNTLIIVISFLDHYLVISGSIVWSVMITTLLATQTSTSEQLLLQLLQDIPDVTHEPPLSVLSCMLTLNQCLFFFHFIFDLGLMGWRVKTQTGNNTVKRKYVHEQNKVFIIQCIYFKNLPKYHTLQNKSLKIKSCYIWNQMHKCLDKFWNLQIKVSKWEICIFSLGLCAGPLFYLML